jgi:prepilin-type N-terminal cleavage/methylation domain-containing protein
VREKLEGIKIRLYCKTCGKKIYPKVKDKELVGEFVADKLTYSEILDHMVILRGIINCNTCNSSKGNKLEDKYREMIANINAMSDNELDEMVENDKCPFQPELIPHEYALGMFHCQCCGEMVLSGFPHPRKSDLPKMQDSTKGFTISELLTVIVVFLILISCIFTIIKSDDYKLMFKEKYIGRVLEQNLNK